MISNKPLSVREKKEQSIAFGEGDVITRMMEILEYRGYVDTDWRDECTFEEEVRPLFKKMLKRAFPESFTCN